MPELVLFPRGRVLLPGQRLKLRVHDVGLSGLLADVEEFCSVFSPHPDVLSPVGVRAAIGARSDAAHGRLDIEILGGARLRMQGVPRLGTVEADEMAEPIGAGDAEQLRAALQRGYQRFAAAAAESGQPASISSALHPNPTIASYQAATMLPISHPERQELLELATTTDRLEQELRIVAGETGILRHLLGLGRMGA